MSAQWRNYFKRNYRLVILWNYEMGKYFLMLLKQFFSSTNSFWFKKDKEVQSSGLNSIAVKILHTMYSLYVKEALKKQP